MNPGQTGPTLEDKRKEWENAFIDDDPNSIQRQINLLVFDFASFWVIYHARELAPKDANGRLKISPLLHGLLNRVFFESMMVRIRRLTERKPKNPKKDVCSLVAVLEDMMRNAALLTREKILSAEGIPYDTPSPGESMDAYVRSTKRHKDIDRLTRKSPDRRSAQNRIPDDWFDEQIKRLQKRTKNVKFFANKFIAHAATPESRATVANKDMKVNLAHLWTATATVCKIAHDVRVGVLGGSASEPLGPCELAFLDYPCVTSADLPRLAKVWDRVVEKVRRWNGIRCGDGMSMLFP